jgi:pimeloyl-ACP methyl ester carboxylesterase
MPNLRAVAPALLLLIAVACSSGGKDGQSPSPSPSEAEGTARPTPNASYEFSDCRFEEPENVEVTCGFLTVPENRSDPDSGKIRLHVAVFSSTSSTPEPDAVIYLDGGPGGETLKAVPFSFDTAFRHLLKDRDVILFDQRGVGTSEPALDCPELEDAFGEQEYGSLSEEEADALFVAAASECRGRLEKDGVDLSAYNSAESAADVEDLRLVLGYEPWNLYGISYGTRLALTVARDYPEGVRSIVLDSTYAPETDLYAEGPENTVRALGVLFENCAADGVCASRFPGLEDVFVQQLQRLQAAPAPASVIDPATGLPVPGAVVDGETLFNIIFESLYSSDSFPILPQLIYDVQAEDYTLLNVLLGFSVGQRSYHTVGMYISVQCHEEAPFSSAEAVAAAAAQYPAYEEFLFAGAKAFFDGCAAWSSETAPESENEPVITEVPALVMAGEWDPITPPRWGRAVAERLPNATFVEFPGLGHGVSSDDDCPRGIMVDFLEDPTVKPNVSCAGAMPGFVLADVPAPAFVPPCTGRELEGCLEAQGELQPVSQASCEGSGPRVCFAPLGQVDPDLVQSLVDYYREVYGLEIGILTPRSVPAEALDADRDQIEAVALANYLGSLFPADYNDPDVSLIGLTPLDLYIADREWRFALGVRLRTPDQNAGVGVVSTYRMHLGDLGLVDFERVVSRTRKMVTKYIGLMYYGLSGNDDPSSPLYNNILSVSDLDEMEEPLDVARR